MEGITKFSWATKDGKIILLGDSANATAPNLAQGAGLAI
jgi:2-polyprenyl-6-methoxyphenol hydroxylase-like FAD-dependent oxidoreductase